MLNGIAVGLILVAGIAFWFLGYLCGHALYYYLENRKYKNVRRRK
jgi:hypothetical protein